MEAPAKSMCSRIPTFAHGHANEALRNYCRITGETIGKAQREREMAAALFKVEREMLSEECSENFVAQ